MAKITEKNRGEKVCFFVQQAAIDTHKDNLRRAKEMGLKIDLRDDFERWFAVEQKRIKGELDRIAAKRVAEI